MKLAERRAGTRSRDGRDTLGAGEPFGADGFEGVDAELHGDGGEEESHDAGDNVQQDGVEPAGAVGGESQDEIAREADSSNAAAEGELLREMNGFALQDDDGGDGAGAGEHGHGKRGDGDIGFSRPASVSSRVSRTRER